MLNINTQAVSDSEAIESLAIDENQGVALVEFQNGGKYTYRNVAKSAFSNLLEFTDQSIGGWVNNNLVDNKEVTFDYGYTA